jgi:hypothetical protein
MKRRDFLFASFGFTIGALFSTVFLVSQPWHNNKTSHPLAIEFQQKTVDVMSPEHEGRTQTHNRKKRWSDVKLAIYMTTHLPREHLIYFPCWNDAIQRMDIFKYADLILYTSSHPTSEQLTMLPFRNIIVKRYNNTGYQEGAIQSMIDPFVNNATWFDKYDWVIRINPDVLIRHDAWLIQTMMNTSFDGIFHDCYNQNYYSNPKPKLHSDFYAFRPSAVDREMVLKSERKNAEFHLTAAFRNIYDSGRFAFVEGARNSRRGNCRIEGTNSPVIHDHDLWTACPYYYNSTKVGVY